MENQAVPMHSSSVTEFEDVETSSPGYASRFAGRVGAWLLSVQSSITTRLFSRAESEYGAKIIEVLDVAGGHGQIARALCERGCVVTVTGSSVACEEQVSDLVASGLCRVQVCNLLNMPFPSQSFALVTCFRFLPHCDKWRDVISELCRLSSHSVIIDYPPRASFNALYPLLFGLKKQFEGNTRHFTLFNHAEVHSEFARHGFIRADSRGEFFFPMVLHRVLRSPLVSQCLEALPRALGLTNVFGSPVIARFTRAKTG